MEALFIYLLKSAGILTIFFLAYKFLLQKETFFSLNRHYLLGGIIASLLLPLVVFTSYIYVEPQEAIFYEVPLCDSRHHDRLECVRHDHQRLAVRPVHEQVPARYRLQA